jgi:hypothetical protein
LEGTEVWLHTFLTYIEVNLISWQLQACFPFTINLLAPEFYI